MALCCKVIGLYHINPFWVSYIKIKLEQRNVPYYELSTINDELREIYDILEDTIWSDYEIDQFLASIRKKQ